MNDLTRRHLVTGALGAATTGTMIAMTSPAYAASPPSAVDLTVRIATFNASLNRNAAGDLVRDLSTPGNAQAKVIAEIIQRTDPDIILINEFDYVENGLAATLFRDNYLRVAQNGAPPIDFPYFFTAPSNTGIPSGFDLNNNGVVGGGDDAFGFGLFPGQYGMVVYSKHPIDEGAIRTFQHFLWKDMPGALLPVDPATGQGWYSPEELDVFRLSSKSHWDVPITLGRRTIHVLAAHPTPPTFDGAEDRNGTRNHDEIRLWADYVTGGKAAAYLYDDAGMRGGLKQGERFVIIGDYNADPLDGDSVDGAINQLLGHPRIDNSFLPSSEGAVEAAALHGRDNLTHRGNPAYDTADFSEPPGNLRVDYVLPSRGMPTVDGGVFWPPREDPLSRLTGTYPFPSSDHRLVWKDVRFPH
jgi:hypothetical protein